MLSGSYNEFESVTEAAEAEEVGSSSTSVIDTDPALTANSDIRVPSQKAVKAFAEKVANKSTNTSLGTSDILYPTQKAVKTYVDGIVVRVGLTLFVDSVHGNNSNAERERADKPFATIVAAKAAATVNDTIIVANGIYDLGETVAAPLNIAGLNLRLDAHCVLSPNGMDQPQTGFVISTAGRTTTISGGTLNADLAIQISANNSTLRVTGMEITGTQDLITFDGGVTGSDIVFTDCHFTAVNADFIGNFASGTLEFNNCRFTSNSTDPQDGMFVGGGTLIVNGGTITNGVGLISISGGSAVLREIDFTAHSTGNGVVQTGGTLRMVGCRVNTSANSGVSPVSKVGGATLILDDCTLIAHASADSITAGSAENVKVYGTSVANKAKNSNITIQVGTLTVSSNVS